MRVLVACEESQRVCIAFRERGHEAYSCDIQEPSGGHPEWHILGNCLTILGGGAFLTMDGTDHMVEKWDLIIAHPPCTYLSNAGAARLYKNQKDGDYQMINIPRLKNGILGRDLFMALYNADCQRIAIENPIPSGIYVMPKYSQTIQPYEHGDPYSKKTCLWLKGLPELKPSNVVTPICSWVSGGSKKADGTPRSNLGTVIRDCKRRSKTFPGIAKAMAEQWG